MPPPADDPPIDSDDIKINPGAINVRLDPEHHAALQRIARGAHLRQTQVLRHLIRIADRFMQGDDSPFVDRLEGTFPKRKAG